jgi:hypothetical protein
MTLSEQGLAVYKTMLDQISFLKKQQWTITNYLVLLYGAFFWFGSNVKDLSGLEKYLLSAIVVIACIYNVALLFLIQWDLSQARRRINDADDTIFDSDEKSGLGITKYRGPHPFWRGFSFLVALIGVSVFGAILLIWFLWRG